MRMGVSIDDFALIHSLSKFDVDAFGVHSRERGNAYSCSKIGRKRVLSVYFCHLPTYDVSSKSLLCDKVKVMYIIYVYLYQNYIVK